MRAKIRLYVEIVFVIIFMITTTILLLLLKKQGEHSKIDVFGTPRIEQIENLGHLAALKVYISDVLEATSSGVKGVWLIRGDAIIGIEMTGIQITTIDELQKTAHIILPLPIVMSPRVDHEKTKTYDIERKWLVSIDKESELRDEAMKQAQLMINEVAKEKDNIDAAKTRVEGLIKDFYHMVGWTVTVEWKE